MLPFRGVRQHVIDRLLPAPLHRVQAGIDEQMAKLNNNQRAPAKTVQVEKKESKKSGNQTQLASNRIPARPPAVKGLTRRERWQLAADLRLIPGRDEGEFPFVLTAEPER